METLFIIIFLTIFGLVALKFAMAEDNHYYKGSFSELPECSHNYRETEYYGGKCGGTQFYECTKCKKEAIERWSI